MLRSVFTKTLWDQRRSLMAWIVGITAVGAFYAAFYPIINTPEMVGALEAYPQAMLDALGFQDVTSPAGYLDATTFGLLGPVLIIIFAAATGGSAIAGEEEGGRLDLTLAHPVSRWKVLVHRFAADVVGMLAVCAGLAVVLIIISGPAQFDEIGVANLVAASFQLAMLGVFFGGLALGVGAASGRRSIVFAVVAVVGVLSYFGSNLAPTIEGLEWFDLLTPFHYQEGGEPLRNGLQVVDSAILIVASIVFVVLGGLRFDRRDVAI